MLDGGRYPAVFWQDRQTMRKLAISLGDKHALPREEFIPSYSGAGSIADGASGPRRTTRPKWPSLAFRNRVTLPEGSTPPMDPWLGNWIIDGPAPPFWPREFRSNLNRPESWKMSERPLKTLRRSGGLQAENSPRSLSQMATISECRYRWLRLPATKFGKTPAISIYCWGLFFCAWIDPNNISDLACRFKSPRNQIHNRVRARNFAGSLRHRCFIAFDRRNALLAPSCCSGCLNRSPTSSLVKQFVECSVFSVHFGPRYRIDDDGGRIIGAICTSTGSTDPILLFSRHEYERAPAIACDLDQPAASAQ